MAGGMWKCIWLLSFSIICLKLYFVSGRSQPHQLNEDNWDTMLTGEWMVEFYAPWCPACKALQPVWEEYSSESKGLGISVGQVDVTHSPGLSGRFMVTALPTIFHVFEGEFRQYRGPRDKDSFITFIEDEKWKSTDAIPSWKSPASLQMSVVAYFFKLSQLLRSVHTKLMEDYGLPTWGSYIIFAVATIILGALLGLILVCVIDFIYPPKVVSSLREDISKKKGDSEEESDDDWVDEELVDENSGDQKSGDEKEKRSSSVKVNDCKENKTCKEDTNLDDDSKTIKTKQGMSGSGDEVEEENDDSAEQPVRRRVKKTVRKAE